ncbi:MAG: hypothetical protein AAGG51_18415 [Cyanobacteria bacterium P01_G01_bin.54]
MTQTPDPPHSPSGPYKSRLFNLINRQRWLWGDRLAQMGRRLQTATVWTGQILLYPLYLLTQLGRGWGLRLEAAASGKTRPLPKPPEALSASDRPIQNTLAQLEDLFTEITVAPAPALALPSTTNVIRAIASDRTSRNLVLVTAGNQAQDCLNPDQQQQLRQLILWEMSDAAHQRYLLKVQANQYRLPQRLTRDVKIWRPVQRFWQLMVWLQQSPIAVATNVFGEAEFVMLPALPPSSPLPAQLPAALPAWLEQLDATVIKLETCQSYLDYEWRQWWQDPTPKPGHRLMRLNRTVQQTVQQSLAILFSPNALVTVPETSSAPNTAWLNWEDLTDPRRERFAATVPRETSLIEAEMIIDLALLRPAKSLGANGVIAAVLPVAPGVLQSFSPPATDPSATNGTPKSLIPPTVMAHPQQFAFKPPPIERSTAITHPQQFSSEPVPPELSTVMAHPQPSPSEPSPPESLQIEHLPSEPSPSGSPLTRPENAPADPDYQPDWIEVDSEPLGYEQHFLARLLNGFDQVMLMIEEAVIALWHWLKGLWQRKP